VATALKLCDDGDAVGWHGNASFVDDHDLWNVGDNFGDNSLSGVVQYDDQDHRRLLRHCKKFEV
jgi:hypothetical protein